MYCISWMSKYKQKKSFIFINPKWPSFVAFAFVLSYNFQFPSFSDFPYFLYILFTSVNDGQVNRVILKKVAKIFIYNEFLCIWIWYLKLWTMSNWINLKKGYIVHCGYFGSDFCLCPEAMAANFNRVMKFSENV